MSVWFAIPSKRSAAEANLCLDKWRQMGYKLALWRDPQDEPISCDLMLSGDYPGYAQAVNLLCKEVLARDPRCDWVVTGGDDILPDPNHTPAAIAEECGLHFGHFTRVGYYDADCVYGTFGVMQPTGDRWGEDKSLPAFQGSAYADRVCGSPWLGRDFCERMYGGNGPLFEGYAHMYVDEELFEVAKMLGVLWQRRDLTHLHQHWGRKPGGKPPAFLKQANSPEHWKRYGDLFRQRKAAGFPGHQPLCQRQLSEVQ